MRKCFHGGKLYANLSTYDAFDPEARKLYWEQCEREIFAAGTDAWWCDSSEPFTPDWQGSRKKTDKERYELTKEEDTRYMDARQANLYAVAHARGIFENQSAADEKKRVFNLTRSGFLSIQKYGAVLWSGDISAKWETLKKQITEGCQMAASGIAWWTLDIGAFFVRDHRKRKEDGQPDEDTGEWFWNGDFPKGVEDMGYRELYTRWIQYGAFLPIMRSHGTDTPREPWNFGEPGTKYYDSILHYIRLRYRLVPYIYSLAYRVCREDAMLMRALYFDYPKEDLSQAEDEYLFGDFLVCPVTFPIEYGPDNRPVTDRPGFREVYLPAGDDWYDAETKAFYEGGQLISAAAPVERMPLFVKAGSIIPVNPRNDIPDLYDPAVRSCQELEVYSGKDGEFRLYLDSGNGPSDSCSGSVIPLFWNDKENCLTAGPAQGAYPVPGEFVLVVYKKDGIRQEKRMAYEGKEIKMILDPADLCTEVQEDLK